MRRAIFAILALAVVFMMAGASAETLAVDLTIKGSVKHPIRTGETTTYEITLTNNGPGAKEIEVYTYTPRYFGDPGFFHNVYVDGVSMGHYFIVQLNPDESIQLDLDVWAYESDTQVDSYWVSLHAVNGFDVDEIRTDTLRITGGPHN